MIGATPASLRLADAKTQLLRLLGEDWRPRVRVRCSYCDLDGDVPVEEGKGGFRRVRVRSPPPPPPWR